MIVTLRTRCGCSRNMIVGGRLPPEIRIPLTDTEFTPYNPDKMCESVLITVRIFELRDAFADVPVYFEVRGDRE